MCSHFAPNKQTNQCSFIDFGMLPIWSFMGTILRVYLFWPNINVQQCSPFIRLTKTKCSRWFFLSFKFLFWLMFWIWITKKTKNNDHGPIFAVFQLLFFITILFCLYIAACARAWPRHLFLQSKLRLSFGKHLSKQCDLLKTCPKRREKKLHVYKYITAMSFTDETISTGTHRRDLHEKTVYSPCST